VRLSSHLLFTPPPFPSQVTKDSSRTKYLEPDDALAYGIVDKVLRSAEDLPTKPSFLSAL